MKRAIEVSGNQFLSVVIRILICVLLFVSLVSSSAMAADRLKVKDSNGNAQFVVTDSGFVGLGCTTPAGFLEIQGDNVPTNIKLTRFGGNAGIVFRAAGGSSSSPSQVLTDSLLGGFVAAGYQSGGDFSANKVGVYFLAAEDFTASAQGTYVTIATTPIGSTTKASKAVFNDGGMDLYGVVTTHSSRTSKDNIQTLPADKAIATVKSLEPVTFTYKFDKEQSHVGFIAEDVPDLVATKDRRGLSAMDIVAVLTKVVKEQNKTIEQMSASMDELKATVSELKSQIQQK
jgi:hypothetical protein